MDRVLECEGLRANSTIYHLNDGFHYRVTSSDEGRAYLICRKSRCYARASMPLLVARRTRESFILTRPHCHGPDRHFLAVLALRQSILERCATEVILPRLIFDEECARVPVEVAQELSFEQMRSTMYKRRFSARAPLRRMGGRPRRDRPAIDPVNGEDARARGIVRGRHQRERHDVPPSPQVQSITAPHPPEILHQEPNETPEQQVLRLRQIKIDVNAVPYQNEGYRCITCDEMERNYLILPCHHVLMCGRCVDLHRRGLRNDAGRLINYVKCPQCWTRVIGYYRVYF